MYAIRSYYAFRGSCRYPEVRKAIAFSNRSGVFASPSRPGSSPIFSNVTDNRENAVAILGEPFHYDGDCDLKFKNFPEHP